MNINKKFNRFQQWGKEKMGGEIKTSNDDDFKALQQEMNTRHEGVNRLHSSMTTYVKYLNKRTEGDSKDKTTAVGHLGTTMTKHGQHFDESNKLGECLISYGQANERIARMQDSYAMDATGSWLESLERSSAQMKDYQNARKKLESRRLAYDTSLAKMQKSKRDDYKAEEELRAQKAKYEESQEEVTRRMQDIIDSENDSMADLQAFLESELNYYDRCRDVLMQVKQNWPGPIADMTVSSGNARRPGPRSRNNTLSRVPTTSTIEEDSTLEPPQMPFRGRVSSNASSPRYEQPAFDFSSSPSRATPLARTTTADSVSAQRAQLRPTRKNEQFLDTSPDEGASNSSGENVYDRSSSPAQSAGSAISRNTSWSTFDGQHPQTKKKAPPPPPPSRGMKPPPPPPPMKRSAMSSSAIPGV